MTDTKDATDDVIVNKNVEVDNDETSSENEIEKQTETVDPIIELEEKLEVAEKQARGAHDRLLRTTADFENQKKRAAREMEDFRKFANEALIKQILTVVDNLERAINSMVKNQELNQNVCEGVDLTLKEILKIFNNFNTTPVEAFEKPFDPNFHQAVLQEETDEYPEGIVIKELQKGYLLHDRLIRPSMVVVSKAIALKNDEETNKKD